MDKSSTIYKIAKKTLHTLRYLQSLPFRLRYRKTFTFGKNCIIRNCKVHNAKGGKVIVGDNSKIIGCTFYFAEGKNLIEIGNDCDLLGVEFIQRYGGTNAIKIGNRTTVGGTLQLECSEGTNLYIGEDCMFSHNIKIWTTAYHSICNAAGKRINPAKSIIIGKHCWIGHSSFIMKGSVVPDGSIVGAACIYTGQFTENNAIYAGCPAKRIKENIVWLRELMPIKYY